MALGVGLGSRDESLGEAVAILIEVEFQADFGLGWIIFVPDSISIQVDPDSVADDGSVQGGGKNGQEEGGGFEKMHSVAGEIEIACRRVSASCFGASGY